MKTVKQILAAKGDQVWTITPDQSVFDALIDHGETGNRFLGCHGGRKARGYRLGKRLCPQSHIERQNLARDSVHEIMTTPVLVAHPDQTVEECMAIMTERRIRHLPVVEHGQLSGMISLGDLVKSIIDEQQFIIAQLHDYINR